MADWLKLPSFLRRRKTEDHAEIAGCCSDYIDGELTEPMLSRLENHLSWCGPCTAFISSLRSTVDSLRGLPAKTPPPELKDAIRREVRNSKN